MDAGRLINRISAGLHRRSYRTGKTLGITEMQGRILSFILVESQERPLCQKDIEKEFDLRPPTVTEILKNLEERGMIQRISSKTDGRYKQIQFTPSAEQIRQAIAAEIQQTEAVLTRGIPEEELAIFMRVAGIMAENIKE